MSLSTHQPPTPPCLSIFSWLPAELILQILGEDQEHLDCRDRASVSRTCQLFYSINNPILYAQNIQQGRSSCLFWAAKHGRLDTLKRAIDAGGNVNTESWFADHADNVHQVHLAGPGFSDHNNSNNDDGVTTPLHVAAKYGQQEAAQYLIDHGAIVDAASSRFCDHLKIYWRQYFTPTWRPGWTPLFAALNHGQTATAELLVSHKAESTNVHIRGRRLFIPALHVAAANGMTSVIKLLATHQADDFDINSRDFSGNSALHYASQYWPPPQLDHGEDQLTTSATSSPIPILLSLGADLEGVNNRLQNPLIHACWLGNWTVATQLVQAGANPKAECYVREVQKLARPLYLASLSRADITRQSGSEPYQDKVAWEAARGVFFKALVAAGVNVNARLTYSRSFDIPMLQRVCLDNDYFAAKTLLHVAGADVDSTDGLGQTALLGYLRFVGQRPPYAFNRANVAAEIFELLLASGARLDVPDENGCDALEQAMDWSLAGADLAGSLRSLLRLADAQNVSEERIEAAISACCEKIVSEVDQSPETLVANLLLDFRQKVWGRGRLF